MYANNPNSNRRRKSLFLLVLLTAVICASAFIVSDSADKTLAETAEGSTFTAVNDDGVSIKYKVLSATEHTVEVYNRDYNAAVDTAHTGHLTIPKTVTDSDSTTYSVVSIGNYAFENCNFSSIELPEGIAKIGIQAFESSKISSINIPEGVTEINHRAFGACEKLIKVTIPSTVKVINPTTFESCDALAEVYNLSECLFVAGSYGLNTPLPLKVHTDATEQSILKTIENSTFAYNGEKAMLVKYEPTSKDVILPGSFEFDDVTIHSYIIAGDLLKNNTTMETLKISSAVSEIFSGAFEGCASLKTVMFENGCVTLGQGIFSGCTSLIEVTLPDSLENESRYTFDNCTSLTTIHIGSGIKSLNFFESFRGCTSLKTIDVSTENPYLTTDANGIVYRLTEDGAVLTKLPPASEIPNLDVPSTIGYGDESKSVISIDEGAFRDALNLISISIPNTITVMGNRLFLDCSNLENVKLPDTLTTIDYYMFYHCKSLRSIELPSSIDSIKSYAFHECDALTSITIPNNVTEIGGEAFYKCGALESVELSHSLTTIGPRAFGECANLSSIEIPNSVTTIDHSAFNNCTSLQSITIPHSVETVGADAFSRTNIKTINFETGFRGVIKEDSFNVSLNDGTNDVMDAADLAGNTFVLTTSPAKYVKACPVKFVFGEETVEEYIFFNQPLTVPATITPSANHTIAWFTDEACSVGNEWVINSDGITAPLTLYGKEALTEYRVVFHSNYGTDTTKIQNKTYGGNTALTSISALFTRAGYSFMGWGTDSENLVVEYSDGQEVDFVTDGTCDLYAVWAETNYNVTFHINDGESSDTHTQTKSHNVSSALDSISTIGFTRTGYKFLGWATSADGVARYADGTQEDLDTGTESSISLYAVWIKENNYSGVYDGEHHEISVTGNVSEVYYAQSELNSSNYNTAASNPIGSQDVCSMTVYYYALGTNGCYATGSLSLEITQKDVTVTAANATKVFGEPDPPFDVTVDGLIGENTIEYSITRTFGDYVGTYAINVTGEASQGNYNVSFVNGIMDILIATITESQFTVDITNATYSGSPITDRVSSSLDTGDYAVAYTDNVNAGTATISIVGMGNYQGTLTYSFEIYATVVFDNKGHGTAPPSEQISGVVLHKPSDLSETGYTFKGWYTDAACTTAYLFDTPVIKDITLYAGWEINQYTITFNTDGGNAIDAITQNFGTSVTAPADPVKEGYTFDRWNVPVPETMPAENVTITAIWLVNQYTITFDTVGGSAIDAITQDFGTSVNAPADPLKDGHTFNGWDIPVPETMPAGNITITASWSINQYTITFDTDGGSAIDEITQDYGSTVVAPANPTKEGHTFNGWDIPVPETMPAGNITITASWSINQYTITFDTDGGSAIDAITQNFGTSVTAPADPVKKGYTFDRWDVPVPETMPAENVTITASWSINQYTITFDTVGGSTVESITADYGSAISAPANPTKEGYVFKRWSEAIPATMPLDGMNVIAIWKTVPIVNDDGTATVGSKNDDATAAIFEANGTEYNLVINSKNWSINIPKSVAKSLNGDIIASVETMTVSNLPEAIRNTAGDRTIISLGLTVNGNDIGRFEENVTVTVSFDASGMDTSKLVIVCIDENGNETYETDVTFDSGTISFAVPHFSYWAVGEKESSSSSDGTSWGLIVAVIAIVAVAAVGAIFYLNKTGKIKLF